jgi:hypothetical protein
MPMTVCCFLLVAHRWHYLLPTIRSRCRLVALPLLPSLSAKGQSTGAPKRIVTTRGPDGFLAAWAAPGVPGLHMRVSTPSRVTLPELKTAPS